MKLKSIFALCIASLAIMCTMSSCSSSKQEVVYATYGFDMDEISQLGYIEGHEAVVEQFGNAIADVIKKFNGTQFEDYELVDALEKAVNPFKGEIFGKFSLYRTDVSPNEKVHTFDMGEFPKD